MTYFPFEFHAGLIDLVANNPDRFHAITYADLAWEDDYDYENRYMDESRRWRDRITTEGDDRIHVLFQHDADSGPLETMALVRHELAAGVPSNVMVFARFHDRHALDVTGELLYRPYDIDIDLLKEAEASRFVIGYHANCVEQARWDLDIAQQRFREDLALLRMHFDVKYFSPHGGVRGPNGENNVDLKPPELTELDVRWVHNRHSPSFDGYFSDGGLAPTPDPDRWDLQSFVAGMERGKRYRILTHPQYYASPPQRHPALQGRGWYDGIIDAYEAGRRDFWTEQGAPG